MRCSTAILKASGDRYSRRAIRANPLLLPQCLGETLAREESTTDTLAHGLCDDTVSRLFVVDGELWMNGNRGVAHVSLAELDEVARGTRREVRCQLLQSNEGNGGVQPAGWQGADGRLWFPTIDGVVAVDPRHTSRPAVAPGVFGSRR